MNTKQSTSSTNLLSVCPISLKYFYRLTPLSKDLEGEEEGDEEEDESLFELAGEGAAVFDRQEDPSASGPSRPCPRYRRRMSAQVDSRKQQAIKAHNQKERQRYAIHVIELSKQLDNLWLLVKGTSYFGVFLALLV